MTTQLFCLPYAGGSSAVYRDWQESLPDGVEVWAVELPGRGTRFGEPPADDLRRLVSELAGAMAEVATDRVALFGHSLGAVLALETGLLLEQRDVALEHVIVSGYPPPHLARQLNPAVHDLPRSALLDVLDRLGGFPAQLLAEDELVDVFLPIIRADLALCERHACDPAQPLRCPLTAFGAAADPRVPVAALTDWSRYTQGTFESKVFPGGHFYLSDFPASVLAAISHILINRD